ncbi:hypothetical protein PCYB_125970 [Plasmodium cynomolgi strain B]|uniref:Uncharacterized protein n=1 Tax=Plasmodium cynomolgi (strain B) TaxID=1120755 RepID=K6UEA9_PLACD|nr:hypothetical protein PCYB_125970 [Plasmodium cynomolgi strain B]GAB68031.1 hypothetical protein PCYB_125970 [Plasmodium cynomolgi strain B]
MYRSDIKNQFNEGRRNLDSYIYCKIWMIFIMYFKNSHCIPKDVIEYVYEAVNAVHSSFHGSNNIIKCIYKKKDSADEDRASVIGIIIDLIKSKLKDIIASFDNFPSEKEEYDKRKEEYRQIYKNLITKHYSNNNHARNKEEMKFLDDVENLEKHNRSKDLKCRILKTPLEVRRRNLGKRKLNNELYRLPFPRRPRLQLNLRLRDHKPPKPPLRSPLLQNLLLKLTIRTLLIMEEPKFRRHPRMYQDHKRHSSTVVPLVLLEKMVQVILFPVKEKILRDKTVVATFVLDNNPLMLLLVLLLVLLLILVKVQLSIVPNLLPLPMVSMLPTKAGKAWMLLQVWISLQMLVVPLVSVIQKMVPKVPVFLLLLMIPRVRLVPKFRVLVLVVGNELKVLLRNLTVQAMDNLTLLVKADKVDNMLLEKVLVPVIRVWLLGSLVIVVPALFPVDNLLRLRQMVEFVALVKVVLMVVRPSTLVPRFLLKVMPEVILLNRNQRKMGKCSPIIKVLLCNLIPLLLRVNRMVMVR